MSEISCDLVQEFADGELDADTAERFRSHFIACERCQDEVEEILQIDRLQWEHSAGELEIPTPVRDPAPERKRDDQADDGQSSNPANGVTSLAWYRKHRGKVAALSAVAAAAAALIVVIVGRSSGPGPGERMALALRETRSLEGRSSYPPADRYRPYDVERSTSPVEHEPITNKLLAAFEDRHDRHGLAAAHLLMGNYHLVEPALQVEDGKLPPDLSPDEKNDLALLHLVEGEPERALLLLAEVLARQPRHPQALWNRALALREMGLPLMAARTFDVLAATGEQGWSAEARTRADHATGKVEQRRRMYSEARKRAEAMVRSGAPVPPRDAEQLPELVRAYFYDAVRAAGTAEAVAELRPVAEALDRHYGGDTLSRYLAGSAANPAGPDPNAPTPSPGSGDPWIQLQADQDAGRASMDAGDLPAAVQTLEGALARCQAARLELPCARIEHLLGRALTAVHRPDEALAHLRAGFERARRIRHWDLELAFLASLEDAARSRDDARGDDDALVQAYRGERQLRAP